MALSDYISDATIQTKRNTLADWHITARADGENNFYGFTSTAGFTTTTCASMSALVTAMNALTTTSNVIFECDWDGITSSGTRVLPNGLKNTALTANGAVDWGYNRPNCKVLVRPATGRTPSLQGTFSGAFELDGMHWIEFRDLTFEGTRVDLKLTGTFPGAAISAFTRCLFKDCTNGATGGINMRSVHFTDCIWDNCQHGFIGAPEFLRNWRGEFRNHRNDDIHGVRGYSGFGQAWTAHAWAFGCTVYNMTTITLGTALHTDFFQISHATENPAKYSCLVEFNLADMNDKVGNGDTQFAFGDDGSGYDGDWLIHNNVACINAYHAAAPYDPNDNQAKYVHRNMFIPGGNRSDTTNNTPWIRGVRATPGSGSLTSSENYSWEDASNIGRVNGESFTNGVDIDFSTGAGAPTRPENLLTFSVGFGTNGNGHRSYDFGTTGMNKNTARAKIISELMPIGGWRTGSKGPINPTLWPTDPLTLASPLPDVGDSFTLSITV